MSEKGTTLFFNIMKVGVSIWMAWMGADLLVEGLTTPDHTFFIFLAGGAMVLAGVVYGIYSAIQLIRQLIHWNEE